MKNLINRGGWIPVGNPDTCMKWSCPVCGEIVCMFRGTPSYPTCPFCLSEIPGWEEFESPAELRDMLRQSVNATGKRYCFSEEEERAYKESRHKYYLDHKDEILARQSKYNADHTEERNEYLKQYLKEHPEKRKQYEAQRKSKKR